MKYTLESSRDGETWMFLDLGEYRGYNLDDERDVIEIGEDQDTFGGKYQYRVKDETGTVIWTKIPPCEGVNVNLSDPHWLDEIRNDYGIEKDVFAQAARHWLDTIGKT